MLKSYKTLAVPMLIYGREFCITTKAQERTIQAQEIKFLKRVKGYNRRDMIQNKIIREELRIFSLNEKIKENRIKWNVHLERV